MLLLRRASETGGLKLTATGNLSRAVVEGMLGIKWPDYDKAVLVRYNKVINEPDFLPLHFIRVLMQATKLVRTHRGKLVPTAFWHLNLAYFDGYPLQSWPQSQIGIILWSLSASAHDWMSRETLTRLCTSPMIGVLESQWDFGSGATELRILRPLVWFGLLESQLEGRSPTALIDHRRYRKAPLFDRFLKFNVQVERQDIHH
jgi:hypothetical protein